MTTHKPEAEVPKGFAEAHVEQADGNYRALVSQAGLFGQAFFGHKATKDQRRQLNRLWKRAMRDAVDQLGPVKQDEPAATAIDEMTCAVEGCDKPQGDSVHTWVEGIADMPESPYHEFVGAVNA